MSTRILFRLGLVPTVLTIALLIPRPARADDAMLEGTTGVKGEILAWIVDAENKLVDLAEAMPESTYGWTPEKGVRTVGEVYMHVAAANYGIPAFIGVQAPKGFDFGTYEHSLTKKADIIKALKDSFAHMEGAFKAMSDADLEKTAEVFGKKTTNRGTFLLLLSHAHEHLGQSIAYARSNKVTPPWTARRQAAAASSKKE
jgi:uncharacterized damage-inducible protein DinB